MVTNDGYKMIVIRSAFPMTKKKIADTFEKENPGVRLISIGGKMEIFNNLMKIPEFPKRFDEKLNEAIEKFENETCQTGAENGKN